MRNKLKIITVTTLGFTAAIVTGSVFAYDHICKDPEIEILKELQAKGATSPQDLEKLKDLPDLEAAEAKRCRYLKNLTAADKARIVEEKRLGHEARLREIEEQRAQGLMDPVPLPPSPFKGILDAKDVPFPFTDIHPKNFGALSFWGGAVDEDQVDVFSGYDPKEPLQGMVLVGGVGYYLTPTKTGPLMIISEKDGILTLRSIAGRYEVYHIEDDTREHVQTQGGAEYRFDIRTRTFVQ